MPRCHVLLRVAFAQSAFRTAVERADCLLGPLSRRWTNDAPLVPKLRRSVQAFPVREALHLLPLSPPDCSLSRPPDCRLSRPSKHRGECCANRLGVGGSGLTRASIEVFASIRHARTPLASGRSTGAPLPRPARRTEDIHRRISDADAIRKLWKPKRTGVASANASTHSLPSLGIATETSIACILTQKAI